MNTTPNRSVNQAPGDDLRGELGAAIVTAERLQALLTVAAYVIDSKRVLKALGELMDKETGAFDTMDLMCHDWASPDTEGHVIDQLGVLLAAHSHCMAPVLGTLKSALVDEEARYSWMDSSKAAS